MNKNNNLLLLVLGILIGFFFTYTFMNSAEPAVSAALEPVVIEVEKVIEVEVIPSWCVVSEPVDESPVVIIEPADPPTEKPAEKPVDPPVVPPVTPPHKETNGNGNAYGHNDPPGLGNHYHYGWEKGKNNPHKP